MTRFDEDVLEIVMDRTRAWEMLNTPDYCAKLDMESFRDLMLRAGYPSEAVRQAALQRGWDRLSAGEAV